jgi:hypothetical protein
MTHYRDLTSAEQAAIQAFAKAHGRKWKATLSQKYWYNARIWRDDDGDSAMGTLLHGVRNDLGASWLDGYKLPKKPTQPADGCCGGGIGPFDGNDNFGKPRQDFADKLAAMDEAAYLKAAEQVIWLSAYANNNPKSDYHWQATACYKEAERRGDKALYTRAYNQARASAGL